MPAFKQWSPAESDKLVELVKAGLSYAEISKAIGRSMGSVRSRAQYLGLAKPRPPIPECQIDMGCKLRALANTNLSIDDCAIAMGITLERAFFLADWYHIKFHNGTPCDMEVVENLLATKRTHTEIARIMGCSRQKVTCVAKLIRERRDRAREVLG